MPKIEIRGVPGIAGGITVDAPNFATETTLSRLTAIMSKSSSNPASKANTKLADAANSASKSLEDMDTAADHAGRGIQDAGETLNNELSTIGHQFGEQLKEIGRGLARVLDLSSTSGLSSTIDLVGDVAKKLTNILYLIPGIGILGKAAIDFVADQLIDIATGTTKFYIDQTEQLGQWMNAFTDSNLQFVNGIDDANRIVINTTVSFDELIGVAEKASNSLRQMSGGPVKAIGRLSKGFDQLGETNQKYLMALGYSREEILTGMANYGASAERFGKELSPAELADGTNNYLRNLKELQRLTGISAKEQEDRIEANRNDLYIQNQLNQLQGEARTTMESFITQVNPAIRDFVLTGQSNTQESAVIVSQMQAYSNGMANIVSQVKGGNLDYQGALAAQQALLKDPRVIEEMKSTQATFGQVQSSLYGSLSGIVDAMGSLQGEIYDQVNVAKENAPDFDQMKQVTDNVTQLQLDTAKVTQALQATSVSVEQFLATTSRPIIATLTVTLQGIKDLLTTSDADLVKSAAEREKAIADFEKYIHDSSARLALTGGLDGMGTVSNMDINADSVNLNVGNHGIDPESLSPTPKLPDLNEMFNPHYSPDGTWYPGTPIAPIEKGSSILPDLSVPGVKPMSTDITNTSKEVTLQLADTKVFSDMHDQLQSLVKVNASMLKAMERGNTISAQNGYASA